MSQKKSHLVKKTKKQLSHPNLRKSKEKKKEQKKKEKRQRHYLEKRKKKNNESSINMKTLMLV